MRDKAFYIWLLENELNGFRNKLIELSKEIATINKVRNEIDSKLIDEMNKVINAMLKYKSEILC